MNETIFSALAEPNRLHIVELLRTGPLSVGEIAHSLGLNQPQASKQWLDSFHLISDERLDLLDDYLQGLLR